MSPLIPRSLCEPIEGINEGINDRLVKLIASGKIEHRGSKKTGGYYAAQEPRG